MKLLFSLRFWIVIFISLGIIYFYWSSLSIRSTDIIEKVPSTEQHESRSSEMVIVVVVCGDRFDESLTMLKSAIMFTRAKLRFIIISDNEHIDSFNEKLSEWQEHVNVPFRFQVMSLKFPAVATTEWRALFKPCASQRLFLPNVLLDIDAILYVDADTLFLGDPEQVWDWFGRMNSSQMAALAPEHEDPNVAWYNRFASHPYYGKLGVNTGVMLMNLTRMREFQWVDYVIPIYKKYKLKITWGDQDIVNIIFHFHPDKLLLYSCAYNFRPDHCMYGGVCAPAQTEGAVVAHGSRAAFHQDKQPAFQQLYRAFQEFQVGGDLNREFLEPLDAYLDLTVDTSCGKHKQVFLKNIRKYIED